MIHVYYIYVYIYADCAIPDGQRGWRGTSRASETATKSSSRSGASPLTKRPSDR